MLSGIEEMPLKCKFAIMLVNYMPFRVLDPSEIYETARVVDKLGFDGLVTSDHLLYHIPIFEPHIALAAAASVTERVKLSTSVTLAALRRPLVLAKICSTLSKGPN
jgi:alkanesulfonate monooxygenase SsuD/methylene tetrahydromethanopterin reductase-like flavin-dependent oxidoreductase (luciferase family)